MNQKCGKLTPLQKEYKRLIERQDQALSVDCPYCQGKLQRENVIVLICINCQNQFFVDELIELKAAAQKCCRQCWGSLIIKSINSLYCPACDLAFSVKCLLKGTSR